MPAYETEAASGIDLRAAIDENQLIRIEPNQRILIKTGLKVIFPITMEGQVRSRSGLALKNGICVLNSPGTIDADYRGEIGVILYNSSQEPFHVKRGDRIAQLVFAPVCRPAINFGTITANTERGEGGFGSTGST